MCGRIGRPWDARNDVRMRRRVNRTPQRYTIDAIATFAREQSAHGDIELAVGQAAVCPLIGAGLGVITTMPDDTNSPQHRDLLLYVSVASPLSKQAGGAP